MLGTLQVEASSGGYECTLDMLKAADAELKIVIAGNPDLTLDRDYCKVFTHKADLQKRKPKKFEKAKELWTGKEATQAGIIYLAERVRTFELKNGANYSENCFCYESLLNSSYQSIGGGRKVIF